MFIQLRNETGNLRIVKIGFSWTMLFFWFFAPMLRGDWLHMILSLVLGYLTKGLSLFIYPIVYNRLYIMGLLATGWGPARAEDREMLELKGFRVKASYAYREKPQESDHSGQPGYAHRDTGEAEAAWEEDTGYETAEEWESEKNDAVDVEWKEE